MFNVDENIQLKNAQGKQHLNKNSSYSALNQLNIGNRNDELEGIMKKIKELEAQLADAT